ncbi:asparagine synthase-related protein [Sphingopyxis sp. NJF-3]
MSAFRYLLALPRRPGKGGKPISLVGSSELTRAAAPALWCSDASTLVWASDRRTVVLGQLFDRSGSRPVAAIADNVAARVDTSPAILVEDFWGSYLALVSGAEGWRILRDPTGLMPCYIRQFGDIIFLASDIATLEAARIARGTVDWDRLSEFLQTPGIRRRATCIEGIEELPPGVLTCFGKEGRSERRLWTPWTFTGAACRISSDQAVAALRDSVCSSIAAVGSGFDNIVVGMSGGLDSSVVCAALAASGQRFTALTMYTDDPSGDERAYARLVARQTSAALLEHRYEVEQIDLSKSGSTHLPRPVGRQFMQEIERAYRAEVGAHGFDAIFTGNGGDNVFCYLHSAAPIVDRLRSARERRGVARTFVDMCRVTQCDLATMMRATLSLLVRRSPRGPNPDLRLIDADRQGMEWSPLLTPWLEDVMCCQDKTARLPGKRAHIDLIVGIQNHLEGYDRGVLPPAIPVLLAQPIVETCLRIPTWDWCRGGINRAIAREAFSTALPAPVIARRSKSGPESLTAEVFEFGRPVLRDLLLGGALRDNRIIDAAAVEAALDDPAVTRGQLLYRLLELSEAEAWARSWDGRGSSGAQ